MQEGSGFTKRSDFARLYLFIRQHGVRAQIKGNFRGNGDNSALFSPIIGLRAEKSVHMIFYVL